jgi:hypothetical protein
MERSAAGLVDGEGEEKYAQILKILGYNGRDEFWLCRIQPGDYLP